MAQNINLFTNKVARNREYLKDALSSKNQILERTEFRNANQLIFVCLILRHFSWFHCKKIENYFLRDIEKFR